MIQWEGITGKPTSDRQVDKYKKMQASAWPDPQGSRQSDMEELTNFTIVGIKNFKPNRL